MLIPGLLAVVAVGGCGSSGQTCTAIGSPPGINVLAPEVPGEATSGESASGEAPSGEAPSGESQPGGPEPGDPAPGGTTPTAPAPSGDGLVPTDLVLEACWDGTCQEYEVSRHWSSEPQRGFVEIRELPAEPVRVTLVADGRRLNPVTVVPEPVRPNGDECPALGPAASVTVDRDAAVRPG
ncbi:hypothetical protein FB384_002084 [Prauserella sediminis]|uniref:Uncharacterized protein n=1 Tax=Prauserella sediminis TaxID=577680 RepID=A0A839XIS9_9PSEU|nr:hypothetical protein [Prauserella sediminis]MBB3663180.1 hypothetical protein [Prauserella sediminis]